MAPHVSTSPDLAREEAQLLERLLGLYAEEARVYREVLALSHRQAAAIAAGRPLTELRRLLQDKRRRLEAIARLEHAAQASKRRWREGRPQWSATGRASLHRALHDVGALIEDILQCEAENDHALLAQTR